MHETNSDNEDIKFGDEVASYNQKLLGGTFCKLSNL